MNFVLAEIALEVLQKRNFLLKLLGVVRKAVLHLHVLLLVTVNLAPLVVVEH